MRTFPKQRDEQLDQATGSQIGPALCFAGGAFALAHQYSIEYDKIQPTV